MKKNKRMERLIHKMNKRKNDIYQLRARLQSQGVHQYDKSYPTYIEWAIKTGHSGWAA